MPEAVNDHGQVVGRNTTDLGEMHAFLWTAEEGMVDLGTLPGADLVSDAWGINDLGQVVGRSQAFPYPSGGEPACLWSRSR